MAQISVPAGPPGTGVITNAMIASDAAIAYSKMQETSELLGIINKYKDGDQNVANSVTLEDDDDLFFTLDTSSDWTFECMIQLSSAINVDLDLSWTDPSGVFQLYWEYIDGGGTLLSEGILLDTTGEVHFDTADSTRHLLFFHGFLRNMGSGTFQLEWAQGTSSGTNAFIRAGSWLRAMRVL